MSFDDIRNAVSATEQEEAAEKVTLLGQIADLTAQRDTARQDMARMEAEFAAHMATHEPTPDPDPDPEPEPVKKVIIGMSSPAGIWNQRVQEVGPGLGARRIFGDLSQGVRSQEDLIRDAIRDGLIPVVSYKGTPSATNVPALRDFLASFNTTITATYWHEPWGDAAQQPVSLFVSRSEQFLGVKSANVKVGPFLNGWLLNNRVSDFKSLTSRRLLDEWDFMGIDTYEEGTIENPGDIKPASRIPLLAKFMRDNGIPDKPVVIGEYNGYSYASIKAAGDAILSMPNMWIGCMWNSTTGKGHVLTGDRLRAFKETLADPRVKR